VFGGGARLSSRKLEQRPDGPHDGARGDDRQATVHERPHREQWNLSPEDAAHDHQNRRACERDPGAESHGRQRQQHALPARVVFGRCRVRDAFHRQLERGRESEESDAGDAKRDAEELRHSAGTFGIPAVPDLERDHHEREQRDEADKPPDARTCAGKCPANDGPDRGDLRRSGGWLQGPGLSR
jgi:hypothetical protein